MPQKYYIDTCIWRDFHENREDKYRPLGEWAFNLFRMIRETKSKVLYSDLIIKELLVAYDEKNISQIFKIMQEEELLEKVEIGPEQIQEAIRLQRKKNLPFGDLLHAILARDYNAIMVTRDRHFENFTDIVVIKKPEDLI